jgi:putative transposase
MEVQRTYRYRVYPTAQQAKMLRQAFGCGRFVANHLLAEMRSLGQWLSYETMCTRLPGLRRTYPWLAEVSAQMLQQALKDLRRAVVNHLEGRARAPRFQQRRGKQSCRFPQYFKLEQNEKRNSRVYVQKVGWLRLTLHRALAGTPHAVTVTCNSAGKYYVCISVTENIPDPVLDGGAVGIDRGLRNLMTLSTGEHIQNPRWLRKAEKRLRHLGRRLSRRAHGSGSWERAHKTLARQYEKVANQRADFYHKLSRRLVEENQLIRLETLAVGGMLKNRRLSKSIADAGWSMFERYLTYKGACYGCRVEQIDRWYPSSQVCHMCGYQYARLTLAERQWMCPACGVTHDRDLNAAINILRHEVRREAPKLTLVESGDPTPSRGDAC